MKRAPLLVASLLGVAVAAAAMVALPTASAAQASLEQATVQQASVKQISVQQAAESASEIQVISGFVTDEIGAPVAETTVWAGVSELTGRLMPGGEVSAAFSVTTGADGSFEMTIDRDVMRRPGALQSPYLTLYFEPPASSGLAAVWLDGALTPTRARFVDIRTDAPDVTIRQSLPAAATVTGRVVDREGNPSADALVRLIHRGEWTALGTPRGWLTTRTGSDGRYRFDGLPPGNVVILAFPRGDLGEYHDGSHVTTVEAGDVPSLRLDPGGRIEAPEIRGDEPGRINVRALSPEGEPVPGVRIWTWIQERGAAVPVFTDANGWASFLSLSPGSYEIWTTGAAEWLEQRYPSGSLDDEPQRVAVGAAETVNLEFVMSPAPPAPRPAESPVINAVQQVGPGAVEIFGALVPDARDVERVEVFQNGQLVGTFTPLQLAFEDLIITDVPPGGGWFQVEWVDAEGNRSGRSAPVYSDVDDARFVAPIDLRVEYLTTRLDIGPNPVCGTISAAIPADHRERSFLLLDDLRQLSEYTTDAPGARVRADGRWEFDFCIRNTGRIAHLQLQVLSELRGIASSVRSAPLPVFIGRDWAPTGFTVDADGTATWNAPQPQVGAATFRVLDRGEPLVDVDASARSVELDLDPTRDHYFQLITVGEYGNESRRTAPIFVPALVPGAR